MRPFLDNALPATNERFGRLLPNPCQHQRQAPQHATDKGHHRVGLCEYAGLDEDLAGDGEADGGQQQAGAADCDR